MKNEDILKENNGKKFDIVLMNPPYDRGLGDKFLIKTIEIANNIISIQPANFLIGNKKNTKLIEKLKQVYYEINREKDASDAFFKVGAVIGGDTAIHYINCNKDPKFIFDGNEINIENLDDIRKYTGDKFIEDFNNKIKELYENDNLVNHIKNYEKKEYSDDNDWCIKISRIRGHKGKGQGKEDPDFYTIITNDNKFLYSDTIGQYKNMINKRGKQSGFVCYISFKTEDELNNFVNYCKTDFARTALYLLKTSPNVISGRICRRIPWFDFSDEHFSKPPREIDDWLFKKYDIDNKIRKHIKDILPDYYGIRK